MFVWQSCMKQIGVAARLERSLPIAVICSLLVAGCGGRSDHAPTADANTAAPPRYNAALAQPRIDMEADGLPAQSPPLVQRVSFPDDPNEPFSRNYGSRLNGPPVHLSPSRTDEEKPRNIMPTPRISLRDLPDDLPPDFRERLIVEHHLR
ncbi:MAG: hypothetical protein ACK5KM_06165 [Hyphomicrobiaceae bacterium]